MTPTATDDATKTAFGYASHKKSKSGPGSGNDADGDAHLYGDFDVDAYTKACQDVAGPKANPRAKFLFDSLMKHLHQFSAETDLTLEEWKLVCDKLVRAGQMSDEKRNEVILISDV